MITLTRPPVRIMYPGTFALPGFSGATYTVGRDAVLEDAPRLPDTIAVDVEGAGKEGRARTDLKSVQLSTDTHVVILDPREPSQFKMIHDVINSGRKLVFHNTPFDVPNLFAVGLLELDTCDMCTDTLVYCRLADPNENRSINGLKDAANRHLGLKLEDPLPRILKTLGITKAVWYDKFDLDTPNYLHMAATDPLLTFRLLSASRQAAYRRTTEGHPFTMHGVTGPDADRLVDREQVLNRDFLRRTCRGLRVDPEYADDFRQKNGATLRAQVAELEAAGITPGHSGSLTKWLDERGQIHEGYPRTPKTKAPSGKAEDVKTLDHPMAVLFSAHKSVDKVDKDYLAKILAYSEIDGRIHPVTNLLGAATGRSSMGEPPVHQLPPDARGIIIPEDYETALSLGATYYTNTDHVVTAKGTREEKVECNCPTAKMRGFVSIDWSQIEPVLAANVAGDHEILKGYESGKSDLYADVASFASVPRKTAKVIMLAQLYGEGLIKLAMDLKLITPTEAFRIRSYSKANEVSQWKAAEALGIVGYLKAVEIRNSVFGPLPKTYEYMQRLRNIGNEYQIIPTLSGRIVPVPSGYWEGKWSVQTHKAINYTFQGGAYDVYAESLYAVHEAGLRDAVYFGMHDELIGDAQAAHDIRRIMETPPAALVNLIGRTPVLRTDMAHIGERWYAS